MGTGVPFLTLSAPGEAQSRVQGSVFHAVAARASSEPAALELLDATRRKHHDASHHCSAWRLHDGLWRANDDGEPSGSAGAPTLQAIDGAAVENVCVIVTRYFGGTKLGIGGLVRAYGGVAAEALAAATQAEAIPSARLRICYPYATTGVVMRAIEAAGASAIETGFSAGGAAGELQLALPLPRVAELEAAIRESTGGSASIEVLSTLLLYRNT